MAETSTCTARACGIVTPGMVPTCPACGAKAVSSRRIRILGWVLVVLGVFLIGFMGWITLYLYPTLTNAGRDMGELGRWNGTAEQGRMVLNLFYMVIGLGAVATIGGIFMIVTGRRSKLVAVVMLLGAAVTVFQGWETTQSIKNSQEQAEPPRFVQPPITAPMNLDAPAPDKPR